MAVATGPARESAISVQHVEARAGAYADSVTLLQVTARAQAVDGVQAALVAMATDLNLGLLAGLGLAAPPGTGQNDMLVAIVADDTGSLAAALAAVDAALSARPADGAGGIGGPAGQPPRTTLSAAHRSGPGLVLVSVPGQHAFAEAVDALDSGCDVMIFSDNVPVGQEVWLKDRAAERGLLVMGPDCGTAIVGGGGRDLSAEVGGRSARAALAALDADPATELVVLLSKPPAAEVAADLPAYARSLATPVQFALIGPGQPDLTAAAEAALRATGRPVPDWPAWPAARATAPAAHAGTGAAGSAAPRGGTGALRGLFAVPRAGTGALRGLFAGGTLCDEAMVIAAGQLGPVYSNVPLRPEWRLGPRAGPGRDAAARHVMIDFGDDELTAGRPHPMIDQRLRLDRLAAEAADPATAVIMLDVVRGHGAHPDPAAELAPAISAARTGRDLPVVISLIGASSDPQGLTAQASALAEAGAHVFASNAAAARFACDLVEQPGGAP